MTYEEERIKYENLKVKQKEYKLNLKEQKKKAHKEFVKKHKILFRVMDILVICLIFVNFGAATMTTLLVAKANPDLEIQEANPIQAELNNYEEHPEGEEVMRMLFIFGLMWAFLMTSYLFARLHIHTNTELWLLIFVLSFYTFILNYDMFNNLGYFIGLKIWG